MGLFCVNFHFRSADQNALTAALARHGADRHRILSDKNGWTSLYEEQASEQDDRRIRDLAAALTRDLNGAAIAFMVHDSDIACYWLYENGKLLDEFNSCPDYFDEVESGAGPSGGDVDVLLRFCRPNVRGEYLRGILSEDDLFAENIIERLAGALGIDPQRALADYRNAAEGDGPDGDDDESDDDDDGPTLPFPRKGIGNQLAGMLAGLGRKDAEVDPQVQSLVTAAAQDDSTEIDRLLAAGVAVDGEAPAPLPNQTATGVVPIAPGAAVQIPMTALLAAVIHKRAAVAGRLLDGGADPNRGHPLFGSAVHAAAGNGDVEMLRLLLDRGGDANGRSPRGQTPLQVIEAGRATKERLAQVQSMMAAMGAKVPGLGDRLTNVTLPTEGWDACERLLKDHGAKK
jgi:hypothetical protein